MSPTLDSLSASEKGDTPGYIDEKARQQALEELHILDTPPEERFDQLTRLAQRLFEVESAAITFVDGSRLWFKSQIGMDISECSREDSFCDMAIRGSEIFVVPDALEDSRFDKDPLVTGESKIRFYAGCPLEGPGGERLGVFCIFDTAPRVLTDFGKNLLRELAHLAQSEVISARELDRAAKVQRGLLPKQLVSLPGFQVAGACLPARAVGGDFYDWYPVAEGAAFTLADVMGKGIGSAIIAATVRAVLRSGSRHTDGVRLAVEWAAEMLESDLDEAGTFVTLFHARLDVETGIVRYIDAGHGLTLIVHADGRRVRLATTSFPLGLGISESWEEKSISLDRGDTLIAMSDGMLDLFDGTLESLDEVANVVKGSLTAQAVVDNLVAITEERSAADDVSMLVVRRSD